MGRVTEYTFDWRIEAQRDGWLLLDDKWHHIVTNEVRSDDGYVYLGSGVWAETWPHEPTRPLYRIIDELAFGL